MDLHLSLNGNHDLAGQIHRQLRAAILEGRLQRGDKLPPTRYLAEELGVSRTTVTEVYDRLMSQGFVVARIGAGTYVADGPAGVQPVGRPRHVGLAVAPLDYWQRQHVPASWLVPSGLECDFRIGAPDISRFPFEDWRRLLAQEAREFVRHPMLAVDLQGEPALRSAIAQYIAFTRAVVCTADDIVVTNGAQHAFELLARILVEPGSVVAVEEPGYPLARACFESFGARVVGVPVDAEGLSVKALPEAACLVCVTPSHQLPLGMPMSLTRRKELLAWARAHNAVIVEDDYDSEFRFEERPIDALQNLDRHGLVAYVGTFSKTMFPALRRGFVVAPATLRDALATAQWVGGWHAPTLGQGALARFIQGGALAKHIRKMRGIYDRRRRLVLALLERDFGDCLAPIHGPLGIHLAARLTAEMDLEAVIAAARGHGVVVYPVARFCSGRVVQPGLVLGFGCIEEAAIAKGLGILRQVMDAERGRATLEPVQRRPAAARSARVRG